MIKMIKLLKCVGLLPTGRTSVIYIVDSIPLLFSQIKGSTKSCLKLLIAVMYRQSFKISSKDLNSLKFST